MLQTTTSGCSSMAGTEVPQTGLQSMQTDARLMHAGGQHTQWWPPDAGRKLMSGFRLMSLNNVCHHTPRKGRMVRTIVCIITSQRQLLDPHAVSGLSWCQPAQLHIRPTEVSCAETCLAADSKAGCGAPCTAHAGHIVLCPQPKAQVSGRPQSNAVKPTQGQLQ